MTLVPLHRPVPATYSPLHSLGTMRDWALEAAAQNERLRPQHRVIAATVVGSRLRGVDTPTSDVDVLVIVADKTPAKTLKPWTDKHTGLPMEGQMQSLTGFTERLNASVPYVEALYSPVLLVDPTYLAYFRALQPGSAPLLASHAQRFAFHAVSRGHHGPAKTATHVHAAYAAAHGLSLQLDRAKVAPASLRSLAAATWLANYVTSRSEHHELTDRQHNAIGAVLNHLRGNS